MGLIFIHNLNITFCSEGSRSKKNNNKVHCDTIVCFSVLKTTLNCAFKKKYLFCNIFKHSSYLGMETCSFSSRHQLVPPARTWTQHSLTLLCLLPPHPPCLVHTRRHRSKRMRLISIWPSRTARYTETKIPSCESAFCFLSSFLKINLGCFYVLGVCIVVHSVFYACVFLDAGMVPWGNVFTVYL